MQTFNFENKMRLLIKPLLILLIFINTFCVYSQVRPLEKAKQQKEYFVPVIDGDYVHIYDPQGDVFTGPDTKDLKAGENYPLWQPNDHCFIKGPDKRWHSFGITHPASAPGQSRHQGEFASFH